MLNVLTRGHIGGKWMYLLISITRKPVWFVYVDYVCRFVTLQMETKQKIMFTIV